MSQEQPRRLKKFKRNRRVFANFTVQEFHYIVDMAELTDSELATVVRQLCMAAIKLLMNRREKHAAAGDYIMACLGRGVKFIDFAKLVEQNNKKRGVKNGTLQEEPIGDDGRLVGSVPDNERV